MICFLDYIKDKYQPSTMYSLYAAIKCILLSRYGINANVWEKTKSWLGNNIKGYSC